MRDNNTKVINSAFSDFYARAHKSMRDKLTDVVLGCGERAIELHDARHQRHVRQSEGYGIAAIDHGRLMFSELSRGSGVDAEVGKAGAALRRSLTDASKGGYYGVVVAGMTPEDWYNLSYEEGIIGDVAAYGRSRIIKGL